MKVLHGADFHLGLSRYGHPLAHGGNTRIDDFAYTVAQFTALARDHQVDLAIFAGDTFDSRHPGPQALDIVSRAINDLTSEGVSVVFVEGNHDGKSTVGDYRTSTLRYIAALDLPRVYVFTTFTDEVIPTVSGYVRVVGLPYPHKRAFDEVLKDLSPEERVFEASRRLEDIIRSLAKPETETTIPNIAVGHLTVAGSKTSTEATMRIGWDVTVGADVFDPFDLVALGHIHRMQEVGKNGWYAGSPNFMDFGEVDNPKGFLLHEVHPGKRVQTTVLPVDVRQMYSFDWTPTLGWLGVPETVEPDSIIRLTITLDEPDPARVAKLVGNLRGNAKPSFLKVDVKLPVRQADRANAAIDSDLDVVESLRRWLVAQGHPEEPALSRGRELVESLAG